MDLIVVIYIFILDCFLMSFDESTFFIPEEGFISFLYSCQNFITCYCHLLLTLGN